ncbi:MAG: SH3 domain-containing protein [Anaerolinea sp.]|nr:SH3 domain-containing protein [Anaerolinea sp.]
MRPLQALPGCIRRCLATGLMAALVFSALAMGVILFSPVYNAEAQSGTGVIVNASILNVRSGPGAGFSEIARVNAGAVVTVFVRNTDASWVQVQLASGVTGWVNARYVAVNIDLNSLPVTGGTSLYTAVVTGAFRLNVRSGPGAGFGILATISRGDTVTLIARTADSSWVEVSLANGVRGWINASFLTPSIPFGALPIAGTVIVPTPIPPPSGPTPGPITASGIVTAGRLNVRVLPSAASGIVTTISQGSPVALYGRNAAGNWLLVQVPGGLTGWVNASYILSNYPLQLLPVYPG